MMPRARGERRQQILEALAGGEGADDALNAADRAMYAQKRRAADPAA